MWAEMEVYEKLFFLNGSYGSNSQARLPHYEKWKKSI